MCDEENSLPGVAATSEIELQASAAMTIPALSPGSPGTAGSIPASSAFSFGTIISPSSNYSSHSSPSWSDDSLPTAENMTQNRISGRSVVIPNTTVTETNVSGTDTRAEVTTVDAPRQQTRPRIFYSWAFRRFFLLLTYPFVLVITLASLLLILTFCVMPTMICMAIGICVYYCFAEEPVSLSLLLRRVFTGEEMENHFVPDYVEHSTYIYRETLRSFLIVRRLLRVEKISSSFLKQDVDGNDNDAGGDNGDIHKINDTKTKLHIVAESEEIAKECEINNGGLFHNLYSRHHPFPIQIRTESKLFNFSEPLTVDDDRNMTKAAVSLADTIENNATSVTISNTSTHGDAAPKCLDRSHTNSTNNGIEGNPNKDEIQISNHEEEDEGHSCSLDEDVRDRGTMCDICLLEFEVDHEVAWSLNLNCSHTFHKDCILQWLLKNHSCPVCRRDYLDSNADENV